VALTQFQSNRKEKAMKTVVAAMIWQDGRLLLVRPREAGKFTFVGGKMRWYEYLFWLLWGGYALALRREVGEEIGKGVRIVRMGRPIMTKGEGHPKDRTVCLIYVPVQIEGEPKPRNEIGEVFWATPEDIFSLYHENQITDATVWGYLALAANIN